MNLAVTPTSAKATAILNHVVYHPLHGPGLAWAETAQTLQHHLAQYGQRENWTGRLPALLARLANSALTGRGGAHFPAARKWHAVATAGSAPALVANGAEGEPWSAKDATVLQLRPHLVLDGLAAAAESLEAADVVIWLAAEATLTIHAVHTALVERSAAQLGDPPIRVVTAPHHYLSGESSSIVNALTTGVALPAFQRQPAAIAGIHSRPTLVQNVETLARIGLLARPAEITAPAQLVTVVSQAGRFVTEAHPSQTISDMVTAANTKFALPELSHAPPQAVLLGGFGGAWLPWTEAAGLPLQEFTLRQGGHSLGAGVIALLPQHSCGLRQTSSIMNFMAESSARQCGPCTFGLPQLADLFDKLASARINRRSLRKLDQTLALVAGRGACHHPDGAVRLAASASVAFAADIDSHRRRGRCLNGPGRPWLAVPRGGVR